MCNVLCICVCGLQGKLPAKKQLWGETLDPEKPSVAQIRQAVNNHKQQSAAAAVGDLNSSLLKLQDCAYGSNGSSVSCATGSVSNSGSGRSNNNITAEDLECDIDDVAAGQTWMVMEYADRGCLQVSVMSHVTHIFVSFSCHSTRYLLFASL